MTTKATDELTDDSVLRCPNCSAPGIEENLPCGVCGYRPELAREYFWLYLGGAAFLVLGIAIGIAGVLVDEVGPNHWSRSYRWFPITPCPENYHWLALLVVGIVLSLGGMGLTRHFRSAWWTLSTFLAYEIGLSVAAGSGALGNDSRGGFPLLCISLANVALLARVGIALRRTPPRNVTRLQERARAAEEMKCRTGSSGREEHSHA